MRREELLRVCSLFFFSCVPRPCLVPFSFNVNVELKKQQKQQKKLQQLAKQARGFGSGSQARALVTLSRGSIPQFTRRNFRAIPDFVLSQISMRGLFTVILVCIPRKGTVLLTQSTPCCLHRVEILLVYLWRILRVLFRKQGQFRGMYVFRDLLKQRSVSV